MTVTGLPSLGRERTFNRAASGVARGPSVRAAFGAGSLPLQVSLPSGDTKRSACGAAATGAVRARTASKSVLAWQSCCIVMNFLRKTWRFGATGRLERMATLREGGSDSCCGERAGSGS
ncbi:MAG: hypothetical protein IT210_19845 [Armatimonadetes bacterium]|nr:hypothetical protein [Armatimonadota bacterium]